MKKGLAVSPGIGTGKAYIISEPDINIDKGRIDAEQVKEELDRGQFIYGYKWRIHRFLILHRNSTERLLNYSPSAIIINAWR